MLKGLRECWRQKRYCRVFRSQRRTVHETSTQESFVQVSLLRMHPRRTKSWVWIQRCVSDVSRAGALFHPAVSVRLQPIVSGWEKGIEEGLHRVHIRSISSDKTPVRSIRCFEIPARASHLPARQLRRQKNLQRYTRQTPACVYRSKSDAPDLPARPKGKVRCPYRLGWSHR